MSKKQFIEDIAHDLRTPLAVIRTNTELAMISVDERSELRPMLLNILEGVDHMTHMLNEQVSRAARIDMSQESE